MPLGDPLSKCNFRVLFLTINVASLSPAVLHHVMGTSEEAVLIW